MKILLVYHLRLGDIIRLFPIAYHYTAQGYEVFIECRAEYWPIFKAISYAKPMPPGASVHQKWDKVYSPQIWPERYDAFRNSGKTWEDFVYGIYPEWAGIIRRIVFDQLKHTTLAHILEAYCLPAGYQAVFPFSYSSRPVSINRVFHLMADVELDADKVFLFMDRHQKAHLERQGFEPSHIRCVEMLADLPDIIAFAEAVLTVNTSTTIIASAVRDPDPAKARYFHVKEPNDQDNHTSPNQTVLIP